jgi:hypothetical protein
MFFLLAGAGIAMVGDADVLPDSWARAPAEQTAADMVTTRDIHKTDDLGCTLIALALFAEFGALHCGEV